MIFFDTSVLVSGLIEAHPHHSRAYPWLEKVVTQKEKGSISSHSIAELYSALTTIPVQPKIRPDQASYLIQHSILKYFTTYDIKKKDYMNVIKNSPILSIQGGMIYDALHIQSAIQLKSKILLTFNLKHFLSIVPEEFKPIIKSP